MLAMLFINTPMQAQKIEGAGIPPSKVQAYSNESASYSVSGFEGRLSWDVTYGYANPHFGFSQTEITWNTTSQGKIAVRNEKGESVEVTVQVAPPAPKLLGNELPEKPVFSDIKNCSYYQITPPPGCTVDGNSNAFRKKKIVSKENNVLVEIQNASKQLYYEGDLKVQAIFDQNSLLSRMTTYKYKCLDISYLKIIESPDSISYSNQTTYNIAVENMKGASYKWNLENGVIISGQNTNRITVKPNNPLWEFKVSLDFTYGGFTKNKNIHIPVRMNAYIDGPTDIYNGMYEYTLKTPYTNVADTDIFAWSVDTSRVDLNSFRKNKLIINGESLPPGKHYVVVVTTLGTGSLLMWGKYITKHSSPLYKVECISKKLVVSKNEETNLLSVNNDLTKILIYNQQGILVLSKETHLNANRDETDLNNLKKGVYFVVVINRDNKIKEKILIK